MSGNKILLHSCCAICSAYPIEHLKSLGFEVVCFFFNPNIYPEAEYIKRLEAQQALTEKLGVKLVTGQYRPQDFFDIGLESEPEKGKRCEKCFELRLQETFEMAKKLDIKTVSTSIVISPHKNFKLITTMGLDFTSKYCIDYLAIDLKKGDGMKKSNALAKGLYRQNYCGCKYSIRLETLDFHLKTHGSNLMEDNVKQLEKICQSALANNQLVVLHSLKEFETPQNTYELSAILAEDMVMKYNKNNIILRN